MKIFAMVFRQALARHNLCLQNFSSVNITKNKQRNKQKYLSTQSCLKLKSTSYFANMAKFPKEVQEQKSH